MALKTIEHKISALNNFDGTAPAGPAVAANDMFSYPEQAGGGLFDFENNKPWVVWQVIMNAGDATNINVRLIDIDDVEVTLFNGAPTSTPEGNVFISTTNSVEAVAGIYLLEGQRLAFRTTGGTLPMRLRVMADQLRV